MAKYGLHDNIPDKWKVYLYECFSIGIIILTDLVSFLLDILKFSVDCMVFGTVSSDGNNTFGCNEIWQYGYG